MPVLIKSLLLTTTDNRFNPHTDYEAWYKEDLRLGYDTCGLLARLASASNTLDDGALEGAKYDIVHYNLSGVHILVDETWVHGSDVETPLQQTTVDDEELQS